MYYIKRHEEHFREVRSWSFHCSIQSIPIDLHDVASLLHMQWLYSTESPLIRSTEMSGLKPVIDRLVSIGGSLTTRDSEGTRNRRDSLIQQCIACEPRSSMPSYLLRISHLSGRSTSTLRLFFTVRSLSSSGFSTLLFHILVYG